MMDGAAGALVGHVEARLAHRQRRAGERLRVHLRDGPEGVRRRLARHRGFGIRPEQRRGRQREGQVAAEARGLGAGLVVRSQGEGVEHPKPDGLVAVVGDQHAGVVGVDRLRTRPRRTDIVADRRPADDVRERRLAGRTVGPLAYGLLAHRRVDGVAERVRRHREGHVDAVSIVARMPRAADKRPAVGSGAHVHAGFIGVLEVAVLEVELAERLLALGLRPRTRQDGRLPGGRAAVAVQTIGCLAAVGLAGAEFDAGLVMHPGGLGRLGQQGRVEPDLLEGAGAVVVVGED